MSSNRAVAKADLASVFFALGDKTRLQLITELCAGGALSIAQLTPVPMCPVKP